MRAIRLISYLMLIGFAVTFSPSPYAEPCNSILSPKYQTAKMDWRYWGEARGLSLLARWLRYDVNYLTDAEIQRLEVIHNGKSWVYLQSGEPITVPWDRYYLMVMDEYGRIYMGRQGQIEGLHHSSVPRGGPLAAAGIVTFDSTNNISSFMDGTGHYFRSFAKRPDLNWRNFSAELKSREIDTSKIRNLSYDPNSGRIGLFDRILMRLIDE
jgi:hypothetical protein